MESPSVDLEPLARAICEQRSLRFERPIGTGGFKEAFQVFDGSKPLALKILKPGADPERLKREVDAIRRCAHSNINPLVDVGVCLPPNAESVYLLEGFLAGGTLSQRLRAPPLPSVAEVRQWGLRLGAAVAYLESIDLVHRDLKPDNIMFGSDAAEPILVDFGIARHLQNTSLTPTWLSVGPGTPMFTSPEQINNQKGLIDWRADQFALGVVLSVCLTGRHPYGGDSDNPGTIIENVMQRIGPSSEFLKKMKELNALCLVKLVQPWPAQRYRRPQEMPDAMQHMGA